MSESIRIAFIKYAEKARKAYMFEYPPGVFLEEGDTVIVENSDGDEVEAIVVDTEHFNFKYTNDEADFKRLLMVAGVEAPLKRIKGTVERSYFKWKDGEDEDE
jgi:hypothetical protein